jgi:hypothetical protein
MAMRMLTALLLTSGLLWSAQGVQAQVPRIPVFRPPVFRPPVPPVRVGPHIPHVPITHGPGGGTRGGDRQEIGDEVVIAVIVAVAALGLAFFLWKRKRPVRTAASAAALPPDLIHPAEAVAGRARETERLLQSLAAQDTRVAPAAFRDRVWSVFVQAQQHWEARDYAPMCDLLTPELFARHNAAVGTMRRLHLINRMVGMTIERLELVHLRWPAGDEGQEVAALVTFQAVSDYLSDRGVAVAGNVSGPTRFQEFWVFRRQDGGWKLSAIEMTRESARLEEPNEVAPPVGTPG